MASNNLPMRMVAGVAVPDTPLITAAIEFAKSRLSPMSFNHVMRSFLFGFLLAPQEPRDEEVHAISAILHDMGWDATGELISADKRFEVDGANAARDFLAREAPNWDRHRVQLVWDAIALHTTMSICLHHTIETVACVNGIRTDFTGPSDAAGELSKSAYDAIIAEFPRLNMADGVLEIFCGFCRTKPATTQDNIVGQIGAAHIEGFEINNDWWVDVVFTSPAIANSIRFVHMLAETKRTLDS